MLKFPQSQGTWLTPGTLGIGLAVVQVCVPRTLTASMAARQCYTVVTSEAIAQVPFWVYLIKVSFANLKKMYVQSKVRRQHQP